MTNRWIVVSALGGLLVLGACGGGGDGSGPTVTQPTPNPDDPRPTQPTSDPAYHLGTARFTTHQPDVLEQIGAHHAYARGLSGQGVKIGIDDSIVDYTQTAEFGNRVRLTDADGALLWYRTPFGDRASSDVSACSYDPACRFWTGDSEGDEENRNSWVRQIVEQEGWPTRDDSVFILDEHYSLEAPLSELFRWLEVPTPYGLGGSHGTAVASVAAGTNLGVAPGATIIPVANNLTDDQYAEGNAARLVQEVIELIPFAIRQQFDEEVARLVRDDYANFDIINRSYGVRLSEFAVLNSIEEAEWFSRHLPQSLNAIWQTGTPDAEKTIIVYAAGNDGDHAPGLGALLPYGFPELRGHSLAVVATDPTTRAIAQYSNRCGPLPPSWNAARHGLHYCLAAPGTTRGLVPDPGSPGEGNSATVNGTSFAAPLVSGGLALMMEHFRGTRGNTEIVRRMLDTADRSGQYADLETYGAGHLDLEAALSPVGSLTAGQSAQALSRTTLQVPAAFGSVAARVENIEIASFDEQDFPFWVPMTTLVFTRPAGRSPIPQLEGPGGADTPVTDPNALRLHGVPVAGDGSLWLADEHGWVTGFGPSSATLARLPHDDRWGYGLSVDDAGYLGAQTSGAFGADPRSGMVWASRAFQHDLDGGWRLDVVGTVAVGVPQYEDDAIFRASPSVMSAMSMRVGTDGWGLTVEQPLRAESGTGTFRIENGHMESGQRLYDEYRIPLEPDARETRVTLRHEREALGGDVALMVSGAANAGHVSGEREISMGLAYRTSW